MKKNILLISLFLIPFLAIAQGPWEFTTGSSDYSDWSKSACSENQTDGIWELTTNGGNNPNITNATAGVDADANQFAAITLRLSAGAPTFMRLRFPNETGSYVYKPIVLDPSETDFVTYYIDASNANWTGTVNDIRFQFKDDNGSTSGVNHTSTGETIEIDRIEFINEIPRPEKLVYEFDTDGDDEGFSTLVDATSVTAGGSITITPSAPGTDIAKVTNGINSVNATTNSHMHIVYQNLSSDNNQLRMQFRSSVDNYVAFIGANTSINQNMTSFETISLDLATLKPTEWSGLAQDIQLAIRNTNNTGNSSSAGDFVVDRIVFNSNATLGIDDVNTTTFNISPNPANDIIKVTATSDIESVRIFDITGKLMSKGGVSVSNEINVTILNAGVYFINITFVNGSQLSKKIIKN